MLGVLLRGGEGLFWLLLSIELSPLFFFFKSSMQSVAELYRALECAASVLVCLPSPLHRPASFLCVFCVRLGVKPKAQEEAEAAVPAAVWVLVSCKQGVWKGKTLKQKGETCARPLLKNVLKFLIGFAIGKSDFNSYVLVQQF